MRLRFWRRAKPIQRSRLDDAQRAVEAARFFSAGAQVLLGLARARLLQHRDPLRYADAITTTMGEARQTMGELLDNATAGKLLCDGCHRYGHGYMLNDNVWEVVCDGDELLCLACVNARLLARLDRVLSVEDFADNAPINHPVLWMARHERSKAL